jgi:hypothetical protein
VARRHLHRAVVLGGREDRVEQARLGAGEIKVGLADGSKPGSW